MKEELSKLPMLKGASDEVMTRVLSLFTQGSMAGAVEVGLMEAEEGFIIAQRPRDAITRINTKRDSARRSPLSENNKSTN